MSKSSKLIIFSCILSAVIVLIAIISMFIRNFSNPTVTIFFSTASVFLSNLTIYMVKKKENKSNKK